MAYSFRRTALAAAAAALLVVAQSSDAVADDGLEDFLSTYQCSLAGLLARIHAYNPQQERDRFIALTLPGPTAAYVQCAFGKWDREGLCEASSGWWNDPAEKPHFSAAQLGALSHLGFSTDGSRGNFQQQMRFAESGFQPLELARMMLSALYEGYGASKDMRIEVVAPLALRHDGILPQARCAPIS